MKTGFRQVSINTNSEAEEAVGLLLQRVFGQPYFVFSHPTNITSKVSVFLSEAQRVSQRQRVGVTEGIKNICECGLNAGLGEVEVKRLKGEDWANSWKRNCMASDEAAGVHGAMRVRHARVHLRSISFCVYISLRIALYYL